VSRRRGFLKPLPLRARVILTFTLGTMLLAGFLVTTTYWLSRESMLHQRESASRSQFFANARQIQAQLRFPNPDFNLLLESLPSVSGSRAIVRTGSTRWYTNSLVPDDLPPELVESVGTSTQAQSMRYRLLGKSHLALGIQLRPTEVSSVTEVAYFEVVPLAKIDDTLNSLGLILLVGAVVVVAIGAGIGIWASGRFMQPLAEISSAATSIANGRFATRIEPLDDPNLAGIVDSFNEMAAAMEARIGRDARFASDVSHELRSPLMTLRASIDVMQSRRHELSERAGSALDLLTRAIDRFEHLVQDLLEISQSDAGALERSPVNIAELVVRTVERLDDAPPVDIDEALEHQLVMGDKRRLVQVIENLLTNAAKYAGGASGVRVDRLDNVVVISVEDAGPGVAPSERELIFERFTRGAAARNRGSGDGAGLGLALVREHIGRHGGEVRSEARPDGERGAVFVVELPLAGQR